MNTGLATPASPVSILDQYWMSPYWCWTSRRYWICPVLIPDSSSLNTGLTYKVSILNKSSINTGLVQYWQWIHPVLILYMWISGQCWNGIEGIWFVDSIIKLAILILDLSSVNMGHKSQYWYWTSRIRLWFVNSLSVLLFKKQSYEHYGSKNTGNLWFFTCNLLYNWL